ncbi:hypothetical protein FOMG_19374 [Fusarium oxysporum f. sp. melonis 26406]|uniref:Uncharacterized protein n=1 Tax=Fusarium oxysporum f. sp. melonis 26406 TaxID=1089452 RepID=W9ZRX0_FUSOX|nr:hypothetical protein FOMG_19374 [Fusarium oxysporum f. sp. melonis 26406]
MDPNDVSLSNSPTAFLTLGNGSFPAICLLLSLHTAASPPRTPLTAPAQPNSINNNSADDLTHPIAKGNKRPSPHPDKTSASSSV